MKPSSRGTPGAEKPNPGLTEADFTRIAANGFGDPQNAYCHAMDYFRGHLYVGTTRNSMALLKLFPPPEPPAMDPWPVTVPSRVQDLNMQGQIWRWHSSGDKWEKIHASPLIKGKNGEKVPRDLGYRGMVVFQGRSDPEPALYASGMSTVLRGSAARILRSLDGVNFTAVGQPGLGNPDISTFRSLVAFDHQLFVPPTGEGKTFNSNRNSIILRCPDPVKGRWERACESGFGDPTNNGIFEMAVFNNHLYAGTFNHYEGFQIWKTPATGKSPCRWTKVIERGAYRGPLNEIAMSLCVFDGALYVGSAIQNGGYDRTNFIGPAAGEIIRIYADDSWDLVVGSPRPTPEGTKYPLSGLGPGFDSIFAGYIWRMVVHDGWLYASTFDWSVFLPYAKRPSLAAQGMMRRLSADYIVRVGGGFDLWRTQDGIHWIPVTQNGLRNPYNYGARNLLSTPYGLFLGTANPFGPEVAARISTGWISVPNPNGGAEVWLGQTPSQRKENPFQGRADGKDALRTRSVGEVAGSSPRPPVFGGASHDGTRSPRILLTGATGFIGSYLLDRLLASEVHVRILALKETVKDIRHSGHVEVVIGDLTDETGLAKAVRGVETVYHLAALLPGASQRDLMRANVHGTENLLRACARMRGLRRLVFLSSVAVYGGPFFRKDWPLTEISPLQPRGPHNLRDYGHSKVAAESLVQRYATNCGFEHAILRVATCYGRGSKFAEDLIQSALSDPRADHGPAWWHPMQLIHAQDLAEVTVQAGTRPEGANEIFNVAGIEAPTYRSIATLVHRLAGGSREMRPIPDRYKVWQRYVLAYDVTKARQRLGFMPRVMLQEGLAELVASTNAEGLVARATERSHPLGEEHGAIHSPTR